jgi:hypothetical protein
MGTDPRSRQRVPVAYVIAVALDEGSWDNRDAARSAAPRVQVMSTPERLLDSGEAFSEISVQQILEEADGPGHVLRALPEQVGRPSAAHRRSAGVTADAGTAVGPSRWEGWGRPVRPVLRGSDHDPPRPPGVLTAVCEAASYDSAVSTPPTSKAVLRTILSEQTAGSTTADLDAVGVRCPRAGSSSGEAPRACPLDHRPGSRSQIRTDATSMVPRNM